MSLAVDPYRWEGYPICPCAPLMDHTLYRDSACQGTKLTKYGHVVGCKCRSCTGRRNKRKGHAAQAKMHRALGGTGFTPHDEESARPYTVEVTVMPEVKTGLQIPASFDKFVGTEWFRRALEQATRAVPVGSGACPGVVIRGDWVILDIRGRSALSQEEK